MEKTRAVIVPGAKTILSGADAVSFNLPAELDFQQWAQYAKHIRMLDLATPWYIGELAIRADAYPQAPQIIADLWNIEEKRVKDYRLLAERFPPARRRPGLSWSHHWEVRAYKPDERADELLEQAEFDGWSIKELKAKVQSAKLLNKITVELREGPQPFFAAHPERIPRRISDAVAHAAARPERHLEIDTNSAQWRDLLTRLREALAAGSQIQRLADGLLPASADELMRVVVTVKDRLLDLIEVLERLGVEPV